MGHESDCDTLWPAPAGAACMATTPFLTWRWVAFTMHIGMSVNNSTHARIILFLLLRLIILISAKIVNFGVTQCAAATIFSVFLVLCPICNSGKTVCNILPKTVPGQRPCGGKAPGQRAPTRAHGPQGRRWPATPFTQRFHGATAGPAACGHAPCRSTARHDPGKGGSRPAPPAQPERNPTRRPA